MSNKSEKGILLLQMGGPETLNDIQDFLFNLFNDKYIIQLPKLLQPFQKNLAQLISSRRAPKVAKLYDEIGGGSPILFETRCQANALAKKLNNEVNTYIAMRYSFPFLKDTLKIMESDGIKDLTVIPLYPQYSLATTGSSIIECKKLFTQKGFSQKATVKYIEEWSNNKHFIDLINKRIKDTIDFINFKILIERTQDIPRMLNLDIHKVKPNEYQKYAESLKKQANENTNRILIIFSAHGLPVKYIENGDPYKKQVESSVNKVLENNFYKNYEHIITYQSRVGPVKWLEPNTEDVVKKLASQGHHNVIVVPISFVGDHIETMHEIGIEYKELAEENGVKNFFVTRLPKANPLLIDALVDEYQKVNALITK